MVIPRSTLSLHVLVGGCGSSVLKPLNQGDSAESEQGFKYRAPPLTSGCLDPNSSPLLLPATLSFLFNVLFTSSSSNLSSFRCLLGCKFEFAVKSTRGSYASTATTVVPLPVLFHSHPCSICMFPRDPCSINVSASSEST